MSTITKLGSYAAGEIPEPWVHQFLDADGTAINITGYAVRVAYKIDNGSQVVRTGALSDAANGKASYTWVAGDFTTAGQMRGEMWVGNGSNRYAQTFELHVREPQGGTAPSI